MKYTLITILILALLFSCKDKYIPGGIDYFYLPRECKILGASNAFLKDEGSFLGLEGLYSINRITNEENSVKVENYLLDIYTSNVNPEIIEAYMSSPDYKGESLIQLIDSVFLDEHDFDMERQMSRYLESKSSLSSSSTATDGVNLVPLEYRLSEIKDLKIYSTSSLFGEKAGRPLNRYFQIYSTSNGFVFDRNKQLIPLKNKEWSLGKYLSIAPIASVDLFLCFKSAPPELPIDTRMVVEMELANGEILRDSSALVRLLK
ncbi:hypothetical protein [Marinifilum caeruleilacunae]|uniref:DUF4270 family protein n=1 Tax=Marinifilum caeruleilacunae TaxID=2499076 RepID=A0ABX1WYI8_9BACT|nr:hypothetical protein [Marinifilum caeruleilacunae]NOU60935.1 hypothetical protein [Marinifilum caeruleilacunae]